MSLRNFVRRFKQATGDSPLDVSSVADLQELIPKKQPTP
jgi:transcriptional regulator GlxA family with amidase domain